MTDYSSHVFDYNKLRGRIVEKFGTIESFSLAAGITPTTMGRKLSSRTFWKQDEILTACRLLEILDSDIPTYFFYLKSCYIATAMKGQEKNER